jgi:hypothetical protein
MRYGLFLLLACLAAPVAAADTPYRWSNVTVGAGGFAPGIVYSEAEAGLAYLRTDMGGAYRWDSAEQRWLPLQDAMHQSGYFGIESLAADPVEPNVVHVAAGMYRNDPAAMLRSFDRGEHWEITPIAFRMGGNEAGRGLGERLAIDPANTDILYFGTRHDGLFRSTDRGLAWRKVDAFPHAGLGVPEGRDAHGGVSFVVFAPSSQDSQEASRTIFAGVADPRAEGLYRSDDAGRSWRRVGGGPAGLFPVQAAFGGGRLYVTWSNGIGPNGITAGAVYSFDVASEQWADITPPPRGAEGGFMALAVSRQDPRIIAVASINRWRPGDTVYRSTDAGKTWADLAPNSSRDVSEYPFLYWGRQEADFGWWIAGLAIDPFDADALAYSTGATVYLTRDATAPRTSWAPWVRGIEQTAVITLASLPEGPHLLSGFGDISGFVHTDFSRSPTVMFTEPVFANTNSIDYAELLAHIVVRSGTQPHRGDGSEPTLAWSDNYGFSWNPLTVPALEAEGLDKKRFDLSGDYPLGISADGATFMFMSPQPVYSRDRGRTWSAVRGLPLHVRPVADRVDPERSYALDFARSTWYLSRDGGATFQPVASRGLPAHMAVDQPYNREQRWPLLAEPGASGKLWLVSTEGLYRSADGGRQFDRVATTAVSADDAQRCTLQVEQLDFGKPQAPGEPPVLFAIGSCDGLRAIWRSDDEGLHWQRINDARHEYGRRFRTLAADRGRHGRVFVGTDGRGILVGEPLRADKAAAGETEVERHTLENGSLMYTLTPQLGGRGLAFSVRGHPNLLRVGAAVATTPEPVIAPDGDNYAYLGHIVWVGPQQDWWRDQALNPARRDARAVWPPDPFTVLSTNRLHRNEDGSLELQAPYSPVTGLRLRQRISMELDHLLHSVTAVNLRDTPVSRDIWFNTRVGPEARVYVPVRNLQRDVRLETYEGAAAAPDAAMARSGFFGFDRSGRGKAKAFIQPAAGWIAAFSQGQLFVIEFGLQDRQAIHPDHGQVELYLDNVSQEGLLELEVHAPYRQLAPQESMSALERWRAWVSDAGTVDEQISELRARGWMEKDRNPR